MRKLLILSLFFLIVFLSFCSCDPIYRLIVVNNTEYYKEVTLKSNLDSATYYEAIPNDIFAEGEKLGTKSLYPLLTPKQKEQASTNYGYRFITVQVPPHQRVILDYGIYGYPSSPIIINNDTIKSDSIIKSKYFKPFKDKLPGYKQVIVLD